MEIACVFKLNSYEWRRSTQWDTQRTRDTYCQSHWPVVWHRSQRSRHGEVFEYLRQEGGRCRRGEVSTKLVERQEKSTEG